MAKIIEVMYRKSSDHRIHTEVYLKKVHEVRGGKVFKSIVQVSKPGRGLTTSLGDLLQR